MSNPTLLDLSLLTIDIFQSVVLNDQCPLHLKKAYTFFLCSLLLRISDNQDIDLLMILKFSSELLKKLSGKALIAGKYYCIKIILAIKIFAPLVSIHQELCSSFLDGMLRLNDYDILNILGQSDDKYLKNSDLIFWDVPFILKALPVEKTIKPFLTVGIAVSLSDIIVCKMF